MRFSFRDIAVAGILLIICNAGVTAGDARLLHASGTFTPEWSLLTGYGATHPGFGTTSQDVRTWDVILQRRATRKTTGSGGYRGSHEFLAEAAISHLLRPTHQPPIFALNFLSCWTLRRWDSLHPYIFVGGGPVYTEADIEEMGARLNGNYQAGLGLTFAFGRHCKAHIEYRFHHISNGGRKDPNDPLNSSKVLAGIRIGR